MRARGLSGMADTGAMGEAIRRGVRVGGYLLRFAAVIVAMFCTWFFLYVVITGSFSQHCEQIGGGITRCYVAAPVWGGPLQLVAVAAAAVSAWRVTGWLTERPAEAEPVSTFRTRGKANAGVHWGLVLLAAGTAIPLLTVMAFGCPGGECGGYAFVMIAYSYMLGAGGLLLSAGMYARGRSTPPRELFWIGWLWGIFAVLLVAWTALSVFWFIPRRPSTAVSWLLITGIPGVSGLFASWRVHRLRPRPNGDRSRTTEG